MKAGRFIVPVVLLAALVACGVNPVKITGGSGDNYRQLRADLDRKIPKVLKKNKLSSMVVLVLDDQKVVYANGFGYSDSMEKQVTSADVAYRIGSITKLFTATAILQLQEQGKLNIDDPVQNYVPGFSIKSPYGLEGVTIRSMLSHYSGLPSDYDKGFSSYEAERNVVDYLSNEYVVFKPGEVHAYSNLAFGILGQVVEQVSGQSYGDYLKSQIFDPLGMQNASLGNRAVPNFAVAYKNSELVNAMEIRDRAAGDIRMSANDLALFAKAMLQYSDVSSGASLLSRDSVKEMWSRQYEDAAFDSGLDMGLGWILSHPAKSLFNVSDLVWHDGSTYHYNSSLLLSKGEKLAVIVFSNSAERGDPVAGEVAGNTLLAAIRSKTGEQPEPYLPVSKPVKEFTGEQLLALQGRYLSSDFGEFTIRARKNKLIASVDGEKIMLVPMDDGTFGIKFYLFGMIPFSPGEVKDLRVQLVQYDGEQVVEVVRGPPIAQKAKNKTLSESMNPYLGNYRLMNPDKLQTEIGFTGLKLSDADGYLRAEVEIKDEDLAFYFDVLGDGRARVLGYGRGKGGSAFYQINKEGQAEIQFSGLRFVKTDTNIH